MKKLFSILLVMAFAASIASVAFARTLEEEKTAVRDYLNVVDGKINKYRKEGNTVKVKQLQGEKQATLRRWEKLQAEMAAPLPPVAPVAPAPAPVMQAPVASTGLFGWNLKTDVAAGYYMAGSNSLTGIRGDFILDDPLALGGIVGLGANAVNYRLGLGYMTGKDNNGASMTAIPLLFDGVLNLPADMLGGVQSYIGGGVNYTVYGSEKTAGTYGGQVFLGFQGDIGLGGNSYAELGYSIVRSGNTVKHSAKGLSIAVGQQILL